MDRLKHDAKAFKRQAGVERAVDRLAKEDVDLKEKLVGKQKNIDVNHNGRIDSGDFKKLRATCSTCHHKPCTCSMKEEVVTESYGDMSHEAKELVLHGDNDSNLHFQSHRPIMDNLKKKVKKGTYNPDLATKLWQYHADRAAQSYAKQHGDGTPWHKMFTVGQRKEAAKHWEEFHRHELNESVNDHDLTEARGRPKKNPEANNEEEETAGIHGQLMKRHGGPIKFGNGETAMVTPEQKIKAVSKIRSMMGAGKSADLRDEHLAKIGKSHADFMKYAFEETEMKTTVFTESARMRGVENAVAAVLNQNLNVRKLAEETKWKKNNPGK
jgi:hypothetical protein